MGTKKLIYDVCYLTLTWWLQVVVVYHSARERAKIYKRAVFLYGRARAGGCDLFTIYGDLIYKCARGQRELHLLVYTCVCCALRWEPHVNVVLGSRSWLAEYTWPTPLHRSNKIASALI
jgi:hypothetical protein